MGPRQTTYVFSCDESGGVAGTSTSKDSDLRGNEILIETDPQAFDIGGFPRPRCLQRAEARDLLYLFEYYEINTAVLLYTMLSETLRQTVDVCDVCDVLTFLGEWLYCAVPDRRLS